MRTEIIEILQKKYPEYCMQHIDTANEILRLFCDHPKSECSHIGQNLLRCNKCGKEFS